MTICLLQLRNQYNGGAWQKFRTNKKRLYLSNKMTKLVNNLKLKKKSYVIDNLIFTKRKLTGTTFILTT